MGINGLLKKVKAKVWKISDAKGKRVAIDGFCVLHKAAISCATELALGLPTEK